MICPYVLASLFGMSSELCLPCHLVSIRYFYYTYKVQWLVETPVSDVHKSIGGVHGWRRLLELRAGVLE